ncbi:hypothetical protein [Paraconexibacter sp.]|uniref:hypothetical protein n=1 Tax=Paraconexibacter sp. TaxID=2949640 RepID=UPI003561F05D
MTAIPSTASDIDTIWFLVFFGTLAAATFVAAIVHGRRIGDVVPVAVCVGALVCALNEPIYDELGMITYADEATRAFTAFGRDIPLFLVVGYVPWVAGISYVVARLIAGGATRGRLHLIALGSFLSVVAVETAGTSVGSWTYYGEAPLKYLGVAPMMAPVPIVCGTLIYLLGTVLEGRRRLLIGIVPVFSLPAVYAAAGMPMYVALHGETAKGVQYLAGVATLLFCAVVVVAATLIAERWREGELGGTRSAAREAAPPERARVPAGAA